MFTAQPGKSLGVSDRLLLEARARAEEQHRMEAEKKASDELRRIQSQLEAGERVRAAARAEAERGWISSFFVTSKIARNPRALFYSDLFSYLSIWHTDPYKLCSVVELEICQLLVTPAHC